MINFFLTYIITIILVVKIIDSVNGNKCLSKYTSKQLYYMFISGEDLKVGPLALNCLIIIAQKYACEYI